MSQSQPRTADFESHRVYTSRDFPLLNPFLYRSLGPTMMDFSLGPYLAKMNDVNASDHCRSEAYKAARYLEAFAQSYYGSSHHCLNEELGRELSAEEKTLHNRIKNAASNDVLVNMTNASPPEWAVTEEAGTWNAFASEKKRASSSRRSHAARAREAKKRRAKA